MPNFLFLLALSGVQGKIKGKQIDTPSVGCLASTVCVTYDGFYMENTLYYKIIEVSKFPQKVHLQIFLLKVCIFYAFSVDF